MTKETVTMTEEKFRAFLEVRDSGLTNMFDLKRVNEISEEMSGVILTREECLDIMEKFSNYLKKYKVENIQDD